MEEAVEYLKVFLLGTIDKNQEKLKKSKECSNFEEPLKKFLEFRKKNSKNVEKS
jgi:hypothetical protein